MVGQEYTHDYSMGKFHPLSKRKTQQRTTALRLI